MYRRKRKGTRKSTRDHVWRKGRKKAKERAGRRRERRKERRGPAAQREEQVLEAVVALREQAVGGTQKADYKGLESEHGGRQ